MLLLTKGQVAELLEHARKEAPNEACGILAGRPDRPQRVYRMVNRDKSSQTFFMEPTEQFRVMKEIRNSGQELVGIYHSHPETEAYPSAHDTALAFYPAASYLIISLRDKDNPQLRSFKIREGNISEEELRIE